MTDIDEPSEGLLLHTIARIRETIGDSGQIMLEDLPDAVEAKFTCLRAENERLARALAIEHTPATPDDIAWAEDGIEVETDRLRERVAELGGYLGDMLSYNSDAPITIKDQARQALKGGAS